MILAKDAEQLWAKTLAKGAEQLSTKDAVLRINNNKKEGARVS